MCNTLLTIFSSYGIYNLASELGVNFLDKLEQVADYRSTCRVLDLIWIAVGFAIQIHIKKNNITDIINSDNEILKIWFHFFQWAGLWKGHKVGIRTGNSKLQIQCLSAFAPLFPAAGKLNYTRSVVHFLSILAKYPRIQSLLNYTGSVNLTRDGHYFAFDEALETFGVKFIKQNITGNVINEENLKRQIKSAQNEKERMNLLFSEFLGDTVMSKSDRAVNNRHEILWNLVDKLVETFQVDKHKLFQNCPELNLEGFKRLYECYEAGKQRLIKIFRQEILELEPVDTTGRRAKEIVVSKVITLKKAEKEQKQIEKDTHHKKRHIAENSTHIDQTQESQLKRVKTSKHQTTKEELTILKPLTHIVPTEEQLNSALAALLKISEHWTRKKLRDHLSYQNRKEQRKK